MTPMEKTIAEIVANARAEFDESNTTPSTPPPTVEQQLADARFRELIVNEALMHDVRPAAVRHIVRDAVDQFELQGDTLVPKHEQTDPGDPLSPLSVSRWLQQLKASEPYLFTTPTRAH